MKISDIKTYNRTLLGHALVSLFKAAIRERRKRGKFALQELADAAEIDKAKISRDFAGSPNWRLSTVADVAEALGLDLEITARDRATGIIITPAGPRSAHGQVGVHIKTSTTKSDVPKIEIGMDPKLWMRRAQA
jgi:hypothetical protein